MPLNYVNTTVRIIYVSTKAYRWKAGAMGTGSSWTATTERSNQLSHLGATKRAATCTSFD